VHYIVVLTAEFQQWSNTLHDDYRATVSFLHNIRERFKPYRDQSGLTMIMKDPNASVSGFVANCDTVIDFMKDRKVRLMIHIAYTYSLEH